MWSFARNISRLLLEYLERCYWKVEGIFIYTAKNILQIRKCQEDVNLDKNLQNAAKNRLMNMKIYDNDKSQVGNIKEDGEKRDKKDINISITN